MHPRHRNTGNGYRSSSMGVGLASNRISPEGSVRGHGGQYGSEYRNFNYSSGFGRGQGYSKPFQSSQQPPPSRRGGGSIDILLEAGRLAAEYMVSRGLLPSSVLPYKLPNGSLKKDPSEFQELGSLPVPGDERTSAAAPQSGNAGLDSGSGRRQLSEEFGPRNHLRGRRRATSFRSCGSDWSSQDYSRSNSFNDKARASPDIEVDNTDNLSAYRNQQKTGEESGNGLQDPGTSELGRKCETSDDLGPELVKYPVPDDVGSKASTSSAGKDLLHEQKLAEDSAGLRKLDSGSDEVKDSASVNEMGKHCLVEKSSIQNKVDDDSSVKQETDLLSFCRFAKVPTRTRSSLTSRGSKTDPITNVLAGSSGIDPKKEPEISFENKSFSCASAKPVDATHQISETSRVEAVKETGIMEEIYPDYGEKDSCLRSPSFQHGAFWNESKQETCQSSSVFGSNSMFEERGQKRSLDEMDVREENKKLKEWIPSMTTKDDESFELQKFDKTKVVSEENKVTCDEEVIVAADCVSSVDRFQFMKGGGEPCIDYAQEKQLFPSSFKICDLNLMEASDIHDNHDNGPLLIFPSISETKREAAPVAIDLSISNSTEFGQNVVVGMSKEIEIIDLEDDSAQEDKSFPCAERKRETVFTGLDGFPGNPQNTGDMPDVQDGYGLMISELLGAEFSNCSSVQGDINSIHNEIPLANGEGALADDDLIYMSLGEIPLSMPEL